MYIFVQDELRNFFLSTAFKVWAYRLLFSAAGLQFKLLELLGRL